MDAAKLTQALTAIYNKPSRNHNDANAIRYAVEEEDIYSLMSGDVMNDAELSLKKLLRVSEDKYVNDIAEKLLAQITDKTFLRTHPEMDNDKLKSVLTDVYNLNARGEADLLTICHALENQKIFARQNYDRNKYDAQMALDRLIRNTGDPALKDIAVKLHAEIVDGKFLRAAPPKP